MLIAINYSLGKSLVVKERAIRCQKSGKPTVFISLGSCDFFGFIYDLPMVFDIITNTEMKSYGLKFAWT